MDDSESQAIQNAMQAPSKKKAKKTDAEKEEEKKRKEKEKELKKAEKKAEKEIHKMKKKDEAVLELTAYIDTRYFTNQADNGERFELYLKAGGLKIQKIESNIAYSIMWGRESNNVIFAPEYESPQASSSSASAKRKRTPTPVTQSFMKQGESFLTYKRTEPYLFVQLSPQEVCDQIFEGTFIQRIQSFQSYHHDKKLTILIEGYDAYWTKAYNANSKLLQREAEKLLTQSSLSSQTSKKGKRKDEDPIKLPDKQIADSILVELQLAHQCQIIHTQKIDDTFAYIGRLTAIIAHAPYRRTKPNFDFCPESVKKSKTNDFRGVWANQLQQIHGVTETVAEAIVSQYPSFQNLMQFYSNNTLPEKAKEELLQGLTAGGKRVGAALSHKIYHIFTSTDPDKVLH